MKVTTPIKVRYQETDQMGVVYHANYLIWFEIGRTAFIEELGFKYHEMEAKGIVSPVVDANIQFKHPIRYGDDAYVETWLEKYNGIRTTYGYRIVDQDGKIAVSGETQHVIVKKDNFRPLSLKKQFPNWHEAYQKALESAK
ncbi:YbgC/FadM family acyl-CoA thioesterase [Gracilibacillus salitolerans]|uniref:YbgC/FadM family acyl-CoA thioesterase n=1 Tax=Gracilibacillus salitolerans TaxID=2663022 RepID=A0A5Q2TKP1_9BACI|nr:thioesterase family protein [Gracilibacillus salitolerans]QGH34652.1 YbgC/FadM family acyl-CoA thioesterase [Gracilibacillus salitolerans]